MLPGNVRIGVVTWIEGGDGNWAISSGVERHVDIVEVGGSKPPSPTKFALTFMEIRHFRACVFMIAAIKFASRRCSAAEPRNFANGRRIGISQPQSASDVMRRLMHPKFG